MGKSFNDDIFNNRLNLDSINGLNISKEAIEENKQANKPKIDIDINDYDIEAMKTKLKEEKKNKKVDLQDEAKQLLQAQERISEIKQEVEQEENQEQQIYVKKTMIFKQDYLDIIDGLASINNMQIKDVLNQLLERAINDLDVKVKDKALKTGKKIKPVKENKNIF